jgi:phenylpropionate dioxygenase-like ring-hydroxylating dioxygenase large terminal subunit
VLFKKKEERKHWGNILRWAVHPIEALPEDRPWGVTILGRELVVWKDGEGEWRVFDDSCPHRKVALSEGRKEADGTLACAYHGWRFDGVCPLLACNMVHLS